VSSPLERQIPAIDADVERPLCHVSLLSLKQCNFVTTNLGKSKFAGLNVRVP
jgi:hypothetical protein